LPITTAETKSRARELLEWARTDGGITDGPQLDRRDPTTARTVRLALANPERIEVVEHIEALTRSLWDDLLTPGSQLCSDDAAALLRFFKDLGFFYKYKPYGVKIATPFGYSLFDLHDGQGFSFQIHVEPKLEGFHILHAKSNSVVYLSSVPEWDEFGEPWARAFFASGSPADNAAIWRPKPGDGIDILETETVHAVLGCILEEYAGCSVDAVERLYDPYPRSTFQPPAAHEPVEAIYGRVYQGLPARQLTRTGSGWDSRPVPVGGGLIDVPGELWGGRLELRREAPFALKHREDHVSVAIPVKGEICVEIEGTTREIVGPGEYATLLPGIDVSLEPVGDSAVIALHQVARSLVQADWSR
jgi:hypothetical protein